jgi:Protein of unknown function (DUF4446)
MSSASGTRIIHARIAATAAILVSEEHMGSITSSLDRHPGAIILILACAVIALALFVLSLQMRHRQLERRVNDAFGGLTGDNTVRMLTEYLSTVRSTAAAVDRMRAEHERIAALMPSVVRHVGLVRFSPFHDTGGDQSFALAVLDGSGDGVVVTALHSRTDSRLYAKPVERGKSTYTLTPEEREAMERAFNRPRSEAAT